MDGHIELLEATAPQAFDWDETAAQGSLFGSQVGVTEPLGNLIRFDTFAPPSAEPSPAAQDMAERNRFFEDCLRVQEQERLRLGRELHDSTGQLVLALRLSIAHLRRVHGTDAEESVLAEIDEVARQLDREIRAFAFLQYPAEVGFGGLAEALQYLARGFSDRTGLKVRFSNLSREFVDHDGAAMALLRVAQEALMNVHRHAHATRVTMSLAIRHGMLRLVIRDDGIGMPSNAPQGIGLQGMRHRLERLGGEFAIRRLARGTQLVAAVPA